MKTANLAIVFTDIKGFTERTSRQTLEENEQLLATHDALLRPIFTAFGGKIVKCIGDAFLVTFESPTQAVLAGVAIQDRLWMHNRETAEADKLNVRVAVNVGEVRIEKGDVFGEPVNIAARVEGIAEAGEVFFTESVYLSMNKAEVPAEEVGQFELKGIPGKIRVFKVPHAPYRVEPATAAHAESATAPTAPRQDTPPFGNMGLARMPEHTGPRLAQPAELRAAVEGLATGLKEATVPAAQAVARELKKGPWTKRPPLKITGGVPVLLAVFLWAVMPDKIDRAISAAADAPKAEQDQRIAEAEALIAKVKDPGERAYRRAELTLAIGRGEEAARRFADATKLGSNDAMSALVDMLDHDKCSYRSEAAQRLGQLGAKSAKGKLERLAKQGGEGDAEGKGVLGAVFGCNSKDAAQRALERLK